MRCVFASKVYNVWCKIWFTWWFFMSTALY